MGGLREERFGGVGGECRMRVREGGVENESEGWGSGE